MIVKVPLERQDGSLNLDISPDPDTETYTGTNTEEFRRELRRQKGRKITLVDILCGIIVTVLMSALMLVAIDAISRSLESV